MPHAPDLSGHALDDRYELRAILGEGAFGRVYEGFDRRLARPVAVKVIKPWWAEDPEWLATFERETRLLARMSDPGIIRIYDVGHASQGLYYVSELVDGESLAARLRRGSIPAWQACEIAAQLCRALAGAHGQRVVHRDVKPANIMLSREGRVKVGDFGVARLAEGSTDGRGSHPASIVGTPRYMAPEQGRGLPTTPATDVYSAGVVLYEMLSGAPPFSAASVVELALLHLQEPPPPLSARLPTSLVAIAERALAKDPAGRYADGAEMADALLAARTRTADRAPRRELVGAGTPAAARRAGSLWSGQDGVP
jgi:eukaryotic-like serine/threonine-protein kinase